MRRGRLNRLVACVWIHFSGLHGRGVKKFVDTKAQQHRQLQRRGETGSLSRSLDAGLNSRASKSSSPFSCFFVVASPNDYSSSFSCITSLSLRSAPTCLEVAVWSFLLLAPLECYRFVFDAGTRTPARINCVLLLRALFFFCFFFFFPRLSLYKTMVWVECSLDKNNRVVVATATAITHTTA